MSSPTVEKIKELRAQLAAEEKKLKDEHERRLVKMQEELREAGVTEDKKPKKVRASGVTCSECGSEGHTKRNHSKFAGAAEQRKAS